MSTRPRSIDSLQDKSYALIETLLKSWKAEFDNPDSLTNLYGLCEIDMVYSIHEALTSLEAANGTLRKQLQEASVLPTSGVVSKRSNSAGRTSRHANCI